MSFPLTKEFFGMRCVERVILFGGSPLLPKTAQALLKDGYEVLVYTSPRHAAEKLDQSGTLLRQQLENIGQQYTVCKDINVQKQLLKHISATTLGIGMGQAWQFGAPIISAFGGRLLDFMGIPHPRYRGGAHYTWMIMRGDRNMGCNLQIINEHTIQGEFDSGQLVASKRYQLKPEARLPIHYFEQANKQEVKFILDFIKHLCRGKRFKLKTPKEESSLFLPRLNTSVNGWIDWSWSGRDLERFICAFDDPYAGASTLLDGQRVRLRKAKLLVDESPFHPFQSGLITRVKPSGGVVVATRDGHLLIEHLSFDSLKQASQLKPGARFATPHDILLNSLVFKPSYTANKRKNHGNL